MVDQSDLALAQLSLAAYGAAYGGTPALLPAGFTPVDADALNVDPAAGSYAGGIFENGNAAALVTSGTIDGAPTLVLAFRGSDDREDSLNDLQNINAAYPDFAGLVAAVDAYAAQAGFAQVAVTGHSLGGAMAQLYMAEHPEVPGGVTHQATTFGSPGVLQAAGTDARIENIVIADDPAVFLGTHRATAGDILRADPALAAAASRAAEVLPGLTEGDALATIPFLTVDYVNRGSFEILPAASGSAAAGAALSGLAQADPARHSPELYLAEVAEAVTTGGTVMVADEGGSATDLFYRALYSGEVRDLSQAEPLVPAVLRDWAAGQGLDVLPGALEREWDALRMDVNAAFARATDGLF